jgi:hypothetical protein
MTQLKSLDIELKDLLVEAFTPATSKYVDELPLSYGCSVGKGKEQFGRQNCPFVVLRCEDLDGA